MGFSLLLPVVEAAVVVVSCEVSVLSAPVVGDFVDVSLGVLALSVAPSAEVGAADDEVMAVV